MSDSIISGFVPTYPSEIFKIVVNKNPEGARKFYSLEEVNRYYDYLKLTVFPDLEIIGDGSAKVTLKSNSYKSFKLDLKLPGSLNILSGVSDFDTFIKIPDECHPDGYYSFIGKRVTTYEYNLLTCDVIITPQPNAEAFISLYIPENECEILYEDTANSKITYQLTEYKLLNSNIKEIEKVKNEFANWLGIDNTNIYPKDGDSLYYFAMNWNSNNTVECPCYTCIIDDPNDDLYYTGMLGEGKYKYAEYRDWDNMLYTDGVYEQNGPTYKVDGHYTVTKKWIDGVACEVYVDGTGGVGDGLVGQTRRILTKAEYTAPIVSGSQLNLNYYSAVNGTDVYWIVYNNLNKKDTEYYKHKGFKLTISDSLLVNTIAASDCVLPTKLTMYNKCNMVFPETSLRFVDTNIKEHLMNSIPYIDNTQATNYQYFGPEVSEVSSTEYHVFLRQTWLQWNYLAEIKWDNNKNIWLLELQYYPVNRQNIYQGIVLKSALNNNSANATKEWIMNNVPMQSTPMSYISKKYLYKFNGQNVDSPINVTEWTLDNSWTNDVINGMQIENTVTTSSTYDNTLIKITLNV